MSANKLMILSLSAALAGVVAYPILAATKPVKARLPLCEVMDCPVCEVVDSSPTIPECPTDTGWLCCDDALFVCVPGDADNDGSCGGMYYYCEYYEVNPDGSALCFDEFGQG